MNRVSSLEAGIRFLQDVAPGLVICDDQLSDGDWRSALDWMAKASLPPLTIVTSRIADMQLWAEVLHRGAYDLLAKPYDPLEVIHVVGSVWRRVKRPLVKGHRHAA